MKGKRGNWKVEIWGEMKRVYELVRQAKLGVSYMVFLL